MREFDFSPPPGTVYVAYSDQRESTVGGVITINTRPRDYVDGMVTESGDDAVAPGDVICFERARAFPVADGVFAVGIDHIGFIYGK